MTSRILLIDDNLPDRIRYRRMLQKQPSAFEVVEVEDGAGALQVLDTAAAFDCVLLDQDLPDLQGLDLLDDIRQRPDAPPVVMLTGEEDAGVSIDALRRGAADYLMKRRIDEDRLTRALQGAMERARLAKQLQQQQLRLALFYRVTNQTEDALFIVDGATMHVIECNEAARSALRMGPDATGLPTRPAAFASEQSWSEFCRRARSDGSANYEWHLARDDNSPAIIEILARCIEEEEHPYIVAVGRDVTLRKQREQRLLEHSARDGLTGLWNRRSFDERLEECWRDAARKSRPLALVMLDVDHFKAYNDALGHPAGDACLSQVALALRSGVLRSSSMIARYGGEEFVVLLEDTDVASAANVAERLRATVIGRALPHPSSEIAGCVTISVGAASNVPTLDGDHRTLLAAADAALYRAKQAGRNRVMMQVDHDCGPPVRTALVAGELR